MADFRPDQLAPFETREKLQRTPLLAQLRNMSNYMLGEPEPQGVVSRNLGAADRMPSDGMQAGGGATIVTSVSPVTPVQQVAPSFGEQIRSQITRAAKCSTSNPVEIQSSADI